MRFKFVVFICLINVIGLGTFSQNLSDNTNTYNSNQKPHGKWVYLNKNTNSIQAKGTYKNGVPVGRWFIFDENGNKFIIKKYRRRRTREVWFYPNGKVESKGWSKLISDDPKEINYYWEGIWKFYNEKGKLIQKKNI